jgi:hypothetical protein
MGSLGVSSQPGLAGWCMAEPMKSRERLDHKNDNVQQCLFLLLSCSPALEQLLIFIRKPSQIPSQMKCDKCGPQS